MSNNENNQEKFQGFDEEIKAVQERLDRIEAVMAAGMSIKANEQGFMVVEYNLDEGTS